ncbi:kinesin-like protein KIF9 isoform X2 [Cimex lectularius]|nr:kinesin-like protein KIF9 isoform X2 [Cimex lectularius]XP_014242339.1 kinesin-like protein KIF9 isoform X2 [Cimex lectularius]
MVIIAFGQSDTGKTYTMLGLEDGYNYRGIAPRIIKDTFTMSEKYGLGMEFFIHLSFIEFDHNRCYDLLKSPPEPVESSKVQGVQIKSIKDGLVLLFEGMKRRKFEKMHTHCAPGVVTVHIKGIPVSGSSTSTIFSHIHLVDLPGTEKQYMHIRSDFCQADANITKLSIDKAKTWDSILAKQNGGCQVMGRCPAVFKTSNLIQFLGRALTNGVLRLIGHIRADHKDMKNTLWTLKFGGRLSRKQPGETLYTFSPDYKRLTQLLEEEVKQLRNEIVVSELLRGEYTQLNMCQGEMEHMQRLVKSYVDGKISEACLLSAAKPNVILHALKRIYVNDLSDLKQAFKFKLKTVAEELAKEFEEKPTAVKKKTGKHTSPETGVKGEKDSSITRHHKQSNINTTKGGSPAPPNASSNTTSPTSTAAQAAKTASTEGSSLIELSDAKKAEMGKSTKPRRLSKTIKSSQEPISMGTEDIESGRKARTDLWKEWSWRNQEKTDKLNNLKLAFESSAIEKEKTINEVTEMRNRLQTLKVQLEEARWQRMINFGEHPGIDGARFVTSTAEQNLEDEIKALKKNIYDQVAHMVTEHKEHVRKFNEYNTAKMTVEADFQQYVHGTQMPMVLFPPLEDMDVVPQNPTVMTFQDKKGFRESKSEIEFSIVQAKHLVQKKFKPRKKWDMK